MRLYTIAQAVSGLENGSTTARKLLDLCLERIEAPGGEGKATFTRVYADEARASADAIDALRRVNRHPSPLAGIPISIKDLFDVAGEVTHAGGKALDSVQPPKRHAVVVERCLGAGLVLVGRTNMTEFAYSGIGINPHFGTPKSPYKREEGHIPGGSSSGAAVSVADGMAYAALGTDTGGSCRIPAAYCGVVGFKPTQRRVPLGGATPLSHTLDSIGPLARSVACCATIDAVLAAEPLPTIKPLELRNLRLAVPANYVLDDMEPSVTEPFNRVLNRLANLGARVTHLKFPQFDKIAHFNRNGGFSAAEAWEHHAPFIEQHGDLYDPRVRSRIERGKSMTAADYIYLRDARRAMILDMDETTRPFDAMLMPTSPIAPPRIDALADDAEYTRLNMLSLRNASLVNFLDRCAISLPMHRPEDPPAGLSIVGETGADARLFALAAAIEPILKD